MKIINNNGQYRITLPKDLVEDKGWDKKEVELRFVEDLEGNVFLKVINKNSKHSRNSRNSNSSKNKKFRGGKNE